MICFRLIDSCSIVCVPADAARLYFQLEDLSHVARTVRRGDFMVVNDLVGWGGLVGSNLVWFGEPFLGV